jgi:hypothetical protein
MKFARASLSILLRSNSARPRRISRPCGELVARWQVSPEAGRIECRWLLDQQCADDYLCTDFSRTKRQQRPPLRRALPVSQSCH